MFMAGSRTVGQTFKLPADLCAAVKQYERKIDDQDIKQQSNKETYNTCLSTTANLKMN